MGPETLVMSGRFKVLSHIGGGGMSEVYLAEQVSLGRKVALKVLKRDLGKRPDMAERFKREARLLSTVDHPAVVRVIDFEPAPEATILVLELAEGDTLERALKAGPLPIERAIPLLAQLAEGLAAIHDKGIVHRDIKPQNVVITQLPRGGEQARLLDFGIARLMEIQDAVSAGIDLASLPVGGLEPAALISQPGQVVGTPAFVSPEQAMGKPTDARTDVYSFGVLAYRVITGELPFDGPNTTDFLKQHIGVAPRPPEQLQPALAAAPELVALVMQCLEKKPEARPQNTHELYERLMRLSPSAQLDTPSRRLYAPPPSAPVAVDGPARFTAVQETAVKLHSVSKQGVQHAVRAAGHLSRLSPEWRRSLLVVAALVLAAPAVWAMLPPTAPERAEAFIRAGKYDNAIALVDTQLERVVTPTTGETPELLSLKAAALHRKGLFDDERALLRTTPYQALQAAHPLLLDALAEDFARAEDDFELQALLKLVPTMFLQPHFEHLALEPGSDRQWGALRWLDLTHQHEGLELVDRYAASLTAKQCFIRAGAAKRLAELQDLEAIDALRALSETPKDEASEAGLVNCGQDEAAEAIRQLRKSGR